MRTHPRVGIAAALTIIAVAVTACGGTTGTAGVGTTAPAGTTAPDATIAPATTAPTDAPDATASAPAVVLPSFDPSEILANLEGIDSYRITMSTDGTVGYSAVVVTKPVLSRDISLGEGDDAQRIVVIGDEAWMGSGDALQPMSGDVVTGMLAAFDPILLAGGFSQAGTWNGAADQGVEDKNGVQARHFQIDSSSFAGAMAQMPAGATIDAWVAEEGGYLVSLAVVGEGGKGFTIDVTDVNDPGNVIERPS